MGIGNGGREVGGNVQQGRCSREEDDGEISGMAVGGDGVDRWNAGKVGQREWLEMGVEGMNGR